MHAELRTQQARSPYKIITTRWTRLLQHKCGSDQFQSFSISSIISRTVSPHKGQRRGREKYIKYSCKRKSYETSFEKIVSRSQTSCLHPTQDEMTCFCILKTQRKYKVAYVRHVPAIQKHGYLVFNGHGFFPSCFRHISVNMIFTVEWKPKQLIKDLAWNRTLTFAMTERNALFIELIHPSTGQAIVK